MKRRLGYLISFLIGLAMLLVNVFYQGAQSSARDWFRVLSNAALLPGTLLLGFGLLLRISDEGLFDGIRYTLGSIFAHFKGDAKQYASYYEYTKRNKKKSAVSFLLLPGLFYFALAVVMLLLYYFV